MRNAVREVRGALRRRKIRTTPVAKALDRIFETNMVFVHVPKCGGKSVVRDVYGLAEHDWFGHAGISFYRAILGPKRFNAAFKFAFLRDPVGRCLSGFKFRQRGGFQSPPELAYQNELDSRTFEDFVLGGKLNEFAQKDIVFEPQTPLLLLPSGALGVDRICRFENFEVEVRNLPIDRKNGEVARVNASPKASPPDINADVRAKIADIYAQDYDFIAKLDGAT